MIAASAADTVKTIMRDNGFTNISVHEAVMFFHRPTPPCGWIF
jgi:hypothetical protein